MTAGNEPASAPEGVVIQPTVGGEVAPAQMPPTAPVSEPVTPVAAPEMPAVAPAAESPSFPVMAPAPSEQPAVSNVTPDTPKPKKKRLTLILIILAALFVLGGGATAAFGFVYLKPENVWQRSLNRTADTFEAIAKGLENYSDSGSKLKGSLNIGGQYNLDGTLEGQSKGNNGYVKADLGASGVRANLEMRTLAAENSDVPDVYLKVSGLEGLDTLLGSEGAGVGDYLSGFNDQWYFLDHTLFEGQLNEKTTLSADDIKGIREGVMKANKEHLFNAEKDKGVFEIRKKYGKEKFEGLSTLKFRVGLNKEGLKGYVTSLRDNLKDTKLKDFAPEGQTFEEWLDFDGMIKEIDAADFSKSEDEADVWVDQYRSFIRNVRFAETGDVDQNNTGTVDFGFPYKGGDEYPFVLSVNGKDNGDDMKGTFSAIYNAKSGVLELKAEGSLASDGTTNTLTASLSSTPSNDDVKVEKPEGAKNLLELASQLYGGYLGADPYGMAGGSELSLFDAGGEARDVERKTDINAMHAKLEEFYNNNGYYPQSFTASTLVGIDPEALYDPNDGTITMSSPVGTVAAAGQVSMPLDSDYWYVPVACGGNECQQYVLYSYLESPNGTTPSPYSKTSLN